MQSLETSIENIIKAQHEIASMHETEGVTIGKILEPPPNIKVLWNNIILEKEDLYINEYWLVGHTRTHKGHIKSATQNRAGGTGYALFAGHNHDIDNDYTNEETLTDTLKKGDFVSIHPIKGEQLYILECKVVKL